MRKKRILSLFMATACVLTVLGVGGADCEAAADKETNSDHPTITINAPYKNMDDFLDLIHEKYPEINIEIIPYSGQNTTAWMKAMLKADELPDIYFTTMYTPSTEDVSDKLLDLSGYEFTDNYVQARLREVTVDGAVYMLPLSYS